MGTWSAAINGNDTFCDVYAAFFDLYNQGTSAAESSKQVLADYKEQFNDHDDKINALFGLALAQWETQSLEPEILSEVKQIIETEKDIQLWRELAADTKTLNKRKAALSRFLFKISKPRTKAKRRTKLKFDFHTNILIRITAPDQLKTFEVNEEFTNGEYIHTGSTLLWSSGGGSVVYFNCRDKKVDAKWIDSQTLEITHDKDINFTIRNDSVYFIGDKVTIVYKAI